MLEWILESESYFLYTISVIRDANKSQDILE